MEEYKTITIEIVLQLQFTVPLFSHQHLSDRYLETPEKPMSFMHLLICTWLPVYLTAQQSTSLTLQPLLQQPI